MSLYGNDENSKSPSSSGYSFQTGIVAEYVSDVDEYLDTEINVGGSGGLFSSGTKKKRRDVLIKKDTPSSGEGNSLVFNPNDAETMPSNSILAYLTDGAASQTGKLPVICYPFFPSHFALPLKPGEYVWIVREETNKRNTYYWMCRKHGTKHTEDLNYTYIERMTLIDSFFQKKRNPEKGVLHDTTDPQTFASFAASSNSNLPTGKQNNNLVNDSVFYKKEFTGEPVPPLKRKCSDTLIQGSNNSFLHMTTEKFNSSEDTSAQFLGSLVKNPDLTGRLANSPAIDVCVGRKKEELGSLTSATSTSSENNGVKIIKNKRGEGFTTLEHYEIDKTLSILGEDLNPDSLVDNDATNCGARIYLSNNCNIDDTFGSAINGLESLGGRSLGLYSDHCRLTSDESIRLVNRTGKSFVDMDAAGKIRVQAKDKIELAVRSDMMPPLEPYVLVSQLEAFIDNLCQILNTMSDAITLAGKSTTPSPNTVPDPPAKSDIASLKSAYGGTGIKSLRSTKIFGE